MNSCTICMKEDIIDEDIYTTDCNHIFCKKCLDDWFQRGNKSCPLCRSEINNYKHKDEKYKLIIYERNIEIPRNEINLNDPRILRELINTDVVTRSLVYQNFRLRFFTFFMTLGFFFFLNTCINYSSEYDKLNDKYETCMNENNNMTTELSECINLNDMKGNYISIYNGKTLVRCFYPEQLYHTCFN